MNCLSRSFALLTCLAIVIPACGSEEDDKGYGDPIGGAAEQEAANGAVGAVLSLQSLQLSGGTDEAALADTTAVFGDLATLLSAKFTAEAGQGQGGQPFARPTDGLIPMVADRLADNGITVTAFDPACVTVTADTVTYDNCLWLYGRINGYITARTDYLKFDLEITFEDTDYFVSIDMNGEVDVSSTRVVGDLHYNITLRSPGASLTYDINAEIDVELTNGCATGGLLELHGLVGGNSGNVDWDVWVRVEFGPACGEVRIY